MTFLFAPSLSGWHNRRIPHLFRHGNGELTLLGNLCTLFVAKSYPINKLFALAVAPLPIAATIVWIYRVCRVSGPGRSADGQYGQQCGALGVAVPARRAAQPAQMFWLAVRSWMETRGAAGVLGRLAFVPDFGVDAELDAEVLTRASPRAAWCPELSGCAAG